MRWLYRRFWLPFYRQWALRYIRKSRIFSFDAMQFSVPPGVFHPGIFFSSTLFAGFVKSMPLRGKTVLDVGAGSGVLALTAARQGGRVTALDVNPLAVETTRENAARNGLSVTCLVSDVFDALPPQPFDVVLVNPPFYAKDPVNMSDRAFFAGADLQYFDRFFAGLASFNPPEVYMVLSEDCPLEAISRVAERHGWKLAAAFQWKKWGEHLFVYSITRLPAP